MPGAEQPPDLSGVPCVITAADGWYVLVWVQPGAKKSELCGVSDSMLKIRLAAPAVDNKANQALLEFMAEKLQIRKNKVILAGGDKSRKKKLFIPAGVSPHWDGIFN